jgi:hypothetical protein
MIFITPGLMAGNNGGGWVGVFDLFRSHFKPLSESEIVYCENRLQGILHDLDGKNVCSGISDCGLINQEPFGSTVPFPKRYIASMENRMKEYCELCDDGFTNFVNKDYIVHEPICMEGKCMVKSSKKKPIKD